MTGDSESTKYNFDGGRFSEWISVRAKRYLVRRTPATVATRGTDTSASKREEEIERDRRRERYCVPKQLGMKYKQQHAKNQGKKGLELQERRALG